MLGAPGARGNGRMPGATELVVDANDPGHLVARATFGLIQSFDRGASWQWICEQAINVSGEYDPPMAVAADGSIVLLPPLADADSGLPPGGALVSRDRGCSWSAAPAPLQGRRGVDLALDPSDRAHVVVILSGVATIDAGLVAFYNIVVETRDSAKTWMQVAELPSDFGAETIEIAPSDANRIYVSGTASADPMLGVLERSEDGGRTWIRTSQRLPQGSGSMFVSGVDPTNADRLWVRVPARADNLGFYPARLLLSSDKGGSWKTLATTQHGMFGFALSPDGASVAFGSPGDGLSVGPSDGSQPFTKVADLQVRCLRWDAAGIYACGTEPSDPFTVGLSTDQGASFRPMYKIADTCPQDCANAAQFAMTCRSPWTTIGPLIQGSRGSCSLPWSADAALGTEAVAHPGAKGGSSCSMPRIAPTAGSSAWRAAISCALVAIGLRRRRRPSRRPANPNGREGSSGSSPNPDPSQLCSENGQETLQMRLSTQIRR
jgi:hypothetical protein